jgi:DNA adenine methylase
MVAAKIERPVLRYFGGKWRVGEWVISHFPPHRCYVEPFGGGASCLLQKSPSPIEVYNDADGEVVNFFRMLRGRAGELTMAIAMTPYAKAELDLTYKPSADELERARRMFVRSWQGRGGARNQWRTGWRYQRSDNQRKRTVADWNETARLLDVADRLKEVQIDCADALTIIKRYDTSETLFYCDPPYVASTRGARWATHAYAHEMDDEAHRTLAATLAGIKGMVVVSGYHSPLYDDLYGAWQSYTRTALTEGKNKAHATEVLWLSPAAAARARQQPLWGVG